MKRGVKKRLKKNNKNFKRTLLVTFIFSLSAIILAIYVQINGQKSVLGCSYLDPITIDILAFLASLFLIIEGMARIIEHPSASVKRQFTRIIRVSAGFAILTLHIMQFVHK
ncbi:hypothetical protein J4221_03455 [Candidatus Pacearchaeota archaeon]|nr:hypothetical protein [Candidatus Pacearchaeota archaeon]